DGVEYARAATQRRPRGAAAFQRRGAADAVLSPAGRQRHLCDRAGHRSPTRRPGRIERGATPGRAAVTERTAIVTLAIGEAQRRLWREECRANWARYAQRCGFDLIAIEQPLDSSERARNRSPAWQKLLIAGQRFASDYERLVWLDADILIHPEAPSVVDGVP